MSVAGREPHVSPLLFFGFAVGSIGGPLALVSLYVAGAAGGAVRSIGLTSTLGLAVFVFPVFIWLRYSRRIVSAGGLFAFAEAAAGRRVAWVQGLIWTFSYFLYLPYTVTYIVYDLLPVVFPGIGSYRWALELLLPLGVVALVFTRLQALLAAFLVLGAVQLVLMLVLGSVELSHFGAPLSSFAPHASASAVGMGVGNVSLLLICGSLPLFLAAEVRGGARTVRAGLAGSFALVGAYFVFAAFPLARASAPVQASAIPGFALASAYGDRTLAVAIGVASAASVAGLIVAEYVALSRLLHAMTGTSVRKALAGIAIPFVVADLLSLIDPQRFYDDLLTPSLFALFLSQLIVFAVYPLFAVRAAGRLLPFDLVASAAASGLMLFGLYTTATNQLGLGS